MSSNLTILNKAFTAERNALSRLFQKVNRTMAADDLLQMLWLRIQRVGDNPPIHNGKAYLYRLASNLAVDQGRAEARMERLQAEARSILYGDESTPDVEQAFLAREELERVMAAAERLPEPTRTVFWLNRMKDVPLRDVAVMLGVSRTTVEKHIRRAITLLGDARNSHDCSRHG
ncbi:RNA polymerase sigma factor [Acetobacter tropicalis]|uniref:RNA polymerase sigma factor 70 region 4 type 2 domain-containing protein n=1 Tax=Acetobacter senegalensis TaxID=446692 RepID=A0A149TUR6_9PROT|nr:MULTISPECIES: sigma-70 family RNA polymerase sigma factor [Acetobacter]KXV56882.1 hypothetical protein AD948_15945 [Acetobacter senegalensis]MCG4254543.1 sigma-70 family RNA polymerase sigma factor [Acetobacter senegalensis]